MYATGDLMIDYYICYLGTECPIYIPPPVSITQTNCTSNPDGDITEPFNSTGDLTPTFALDLSASGTCGISNINGSFTDGTTGTQSIVTLPFERAISCGSGQYVYFNCTNGDQTSAYQKSEVWACDAEAAGGNTVDVWQDVEIVSYTNLLLRWNRSVCAANYYTEEKSFDIPALPGWTLTSGVDPLVVAGQSSNCSHYSNVTFRNMYDEIIEVPAVDFGGGNVTNPYKTGNLIDPPSAFLKDGQADCSWNTTITEDLNMSFPLVLSGPGVFTIDGGSLTTDDYYNSDGQCIAYITNGGTLNIE